MEKFQEDMMNEWIKNLIWTCMAQANARTEVQYSDILQRNYDIKRLDQRVK